jgi:hypothetical protein
LKGYEDRSDSFDFVFSQLHSFEYQSFDLTPAHQPTGKCADAQENSTAI